jgi:hypothetical protein
MGEDEPTKRPSRKERKKIERQKREEESRTKVCPQLPLWRRGGKFLLLFGLQVLGVIGGIAAVLSFSPAFSVSSEPSLDPSNVMTSLFLIQYESPIPVADVNPICLINKLESPDRSTLTEANGEAPWLVIDKMWQGDAVTVPCAFPAKGQFRNADVTIRVQFVPILVPTFLERKPWERDFRFVTVIQSDGQLRFVPESKNFEANFPPFAPRNPN